MKKIFFQLNAALTMAIPDLVLHVYFVNPDLLCYPKRCIPQYLNAFVYRSLVCGCFF
jgi:hypothetical protein